MIDSKLSVISLGSMFFCLLSPSLCFLYFLFLCDCVQCVCMNVFLSKLVLLILLSLDNKNDLSVVCQYLQCMIVVVVYSFICTAQYRIVIGLFNCHRVQRVCCSIQLPIISPSTALWVISVLILLLADDVQVNPGPIKSRCKSLSMCHLNVRSFSRSKLLAVKTSLANL